MDRRDAITLAVLFVVALWLWTLPFQNDARPFGEGDSAWHYSIGNYIASEDKPIYRLPFYIGVWYFGYNDLLGPLAPEYPPSNHYNYALMEVAGGDQFIPVFIYKAIASFLGIFAVYFLLRKLFGYLPALTAATALVFSVREMFVYLWGQQPTLIAVVILPVTLYAAYRYVDSFYKAEHRPVYLYMTALLLGSQYLLHIQGFITTIIAIAAFSALVTIKHKRLPISKQVWKHAALAAALLAIMTIPFALIYFGASQQSTGAGFSAARLFQWTIPYDAVAGSYPTAFVSFTSEYSLVLLPLLLAGIGITLYRRQNRDLMMLGWLLAVYFSLHVDVFLGTSVERAARMLVAEPPLFFSFIAIGAFTLPQILRIRAKIVPVAIAAILTSFIVFSSASTAKETLSGAYQPVFRVTPAQESASLWLRENVPEDSFIYYPAYSNDFKLGQWQYPKMRWMLALSQRHIATYTGERVNLSIPTGPEYMMFDYSDLAIFASQPNQLQQLASRNIQAMESFEQAFANATPLYSENNIRVYKIEN